MKRSHINWWMMGNFHFFINWEKISKRVPRFFRNFLSLSLNCKQKRLTLMKFYRLSPLGHHVYHYRFGVQQMIRKFQSTKKAQSLDFLGKCHFSHFQVSSSLIVYRINFNFHRNLVNWPSNFLVSHFFSPNFSFFPQLLTFFSIPPHFLHSDWSSTPLTYSSNSKTVKLATARERCSSNPQPIQMYYSKLVTSSIVPMTSSVSVIVHTTTWTFTQRINPFKPSYWTEAIWHTTYQNTTKATIWHSMPAKWIAMQTGAILENSKMQRIYGLAMNLMCPMAMNVSLVVCVIWDSWRSWRWWYDHIIQRLNSKHSWNFRQLSQKYELCCHGARIRSKWPVAWLEINICHADGTASLLQMVQFILIRAFNNGNSPYWSGKTGIFVDWEVFEVKKWCFLNETSHCW